MVIPSLQFGMSKLMSAQTQNAQAHNAKVAQQAAPVATGNGAAFASGMTMNAAKGLRAMTMTQIRFGHDASVRERSTFLEKIRAQEKAQLDAGVPANEVVLRLLITDVDNTLHRKSDNGKYTIPRSHVLVKALSARNIPVMAVTGASMAGESTSFAPRHEAGELPDVDGVFPAVGTKAYLNTDKGFEVDGDFSQMIKDQGFDKESVIAQANQVVDELNKSVAFITSENQSKFEDFQGQDAEPNTFFYVQPGSLKASDQENKVSFYFITDNPEQVVPQVTDALKDSFNGESGRQKAVVKVASEIHYDEAHGGQGLRKYCVDLLPSSKALPGEDLLNQVRELYPQAKIDAWFAGDSGNDEDFLSLRLPHDTQANVVIVGGAKPELMAKAFDAQQSAPKNVKIFVEPENSETLGPDSIAKHMINEGVIPKQSMPKAVPASNN